MATRRRGGGEAVVGTADNAAVSSAGGRPAKTTSNGSVVIVLAAVAALGGLAIFMMATRSPDAAPATTTPDPLTTRQVLFEAVGDEAAVERRKFLVGFNAAIDVVVPAVELMDSLGLKPAPTPKDNPTLAHTTALTETLSFFMMHGTAAERRFDDAEAFEGLVAGARQLASTSLHPGGNAVLMGRYLASQAGQEVVMLGPIGPSLKELLPEGVSVPGLQERDEHHLILEYKTGEAWGPQLRAARANRFIFSHDVANAELQALPQLSAQVHASRPDIVVLSGVHMLTELEPVTRDRLVGKLLAEIRLLPSNVGVHLELASIADPAFWRVVAKQLIPAVASVGLNEQELLDLAHAVAGGNPDPEKQGQKQQDEAFDFSAAVRSVPQLPSADIVVQHPPMVLTREVLAWVAGAFGPLAGGKLGRIHFHSLKYHIVAENPKIWRGARAEAAAGVLACARQACESPTVEPSLYAVRTPDIEVGWAGDELRTWSDAGFVYQAAPVLVCHNPTKTVGLGDAISAAGLNRAVYVASLDKTNTPTTKQKQK
eukprot:m.27073 g.27073  ORF g.27073 m.27073 type:complete len:542 (-) comp8447_c0_seq1:105-1730(-)